MRVNFAMASTERTGGHRVIFEVADHLARRGHEVCITSLGVPVHNWFSFRGNVSFRYPEAKRSVHAPGSRRQTLRKLYDWYVAPRIDYDIDPSKLLARAIPKDTEINVATYYSTAFAVHRSGVGVPYYYMQHYEALFFPDPYYSRMADETYRLPLIRIANSTWLKNTILERFGLQSLGPIVPGVATEIFHPSRVEKSKPNRKTVLALGKSARLKGLPTLFQALKIVDKRISNVRLCLYGSQPQLQHQSPIPCDYVTKPTDEELAQLYRTADVVVMPSVAESSPLPPLEAMACGAAVLTTRVGTEDYCFHEQNSLVVEPGDHEGMANGISRLLTDDNLSENLRKHAIETTRKFTWDRTTDQIENAFKHSIDAKPMGTGDEMPQLGEDAGGQS